MKNNAVLLLFLAASLGGCDLDQVRFPSLDTGLADASDASDDTTDAGDRDSGSTTDASESDTGNSGSVNEPTSADIDLCDTINDYRVENGLPAIERSPGLMAVARAHVEDMAIYFGSDPPAECNLHSWSDNDPLWSGCCYTSDHAQAQCMWDKPAEITADWDTPFRGSGYEIAAGGYSSNTDALIGWQGSSGHHDVILNQSSWAGLEWRSIGCGSDPSTRYYVVWFSDGQ